MAYKSGVILTNYLLSNIRSSSRYAIDVPLTGTDSRKVNHPDLRSGRIWLPHIIFFLDLCGQARTGELQWFCAVKPFGEDLCSYHSPKKAKQHIPGNSAGDLFGMVFLWPFQRLSDLQLGDEKICKGHLESPGTFTLAFLSSWLSLFGDPWAPRLNKPTFPRFFFSNILGHVLRQKLPHQRVRRLGELFFVCLRVAPHVLGKCGGEVEWRCHFSRDFVGQKWVISYFLGALESMMKTRMARSWSFTLNFLAYQEKTRLHHGFR